MSWLSVFSKKKHKESPPDTPEEEKSHSDNEEFIFVDKQNPVPPNTSNIPSSGLYPALSGEPIHPSTVPIESITMHQQNDYVHYLSGVPFELCKELKRKMNNDFDIDRLRINEIMSFIKRIENENYDYDFSTEEAVIAEMDSRNNECDQVE